MRVAALYDIHSNLPALDAVLAEIDSLGVDQLVIGGDVALGPMPRECLDRLRAVDLPMQFVRGDCDREVLAALDGPESTSLPGAVRETIWWTAHQLRPEHAEWIATWPLTVRLHVSGFGDVVFCHATPRDDNEIFTRITAEERLLSALRGADAALIVCGHTHMQFDRTIGPIRVVNAGSVGMPFGGTGAYWLLLDGVVELRRTEYNAAAAAEEIRATTYPSADDFARRYIESFPAEEQMLEAFARAELSNVRGSADKSSEQLRER
jgi:putative phosphoesterase